MCETIIARNLKACRQRGVVLVAVLWVVGILVLLATGIAAQTRTAQRVTRNLIASEQAYHAAEGGVNFATLTLLGGTSGQRSAWWHPVEPLTIGKARVRMIISDERGKVDLNGAPQELIRGVMLSAGLGFDEADRLTDAILDWRDGDDLRRLHGAEDVDYRAQGYGYGAKDAPFDSVDELQRVFGMRPAVYDAVREAFTTYSQASEVNPLAASGLVLGAIPDMTPDLVAGYLEARDASRALGSPPPAFPVAASPHISNQTGPAYTVRAEAQIAGAARAIVDAVVVMESGGAGAEYRVAEWRSTPY